MARLSRRMPRTRFPVAKTDSQPRSPEVSLGKFALTIVEIPSERRAYVDEVRVL